MMQESKHHAYISVCPGMLWGQPAVEQNRMAAEQVARMWWFGTHTLEDMQEQWPELGRPQVLVSCWFVQEYSSKRRWRKRWGAWAEEHWEALWHADYDAVPMPPQATDSL